ncbi:MAG: 23S rRNA (pseudouridine(1915)-N(3))-methyltransferase RlmH [Sphingobacteriaceae bacterium]|nr:23S rRNA (pseudouridine(1915)-N(3))-methyltransferase RlmH [Sphingobacteriaceae bacterium]
MLKVRLIQIGKNQEAFIDAGISFYEKKLKHYCQFELMTLPSIKNATNLQAEELRRREAVLFQKQINAKSWVVLLDERGKKFDSPGFATEIEKWSVAGRSQIDFLIGGAFGFSDDIYKRADFQISLSTMTFSHQIVRLIFLEQLYRAFTILKNEPYHHA